MTRGRGGSGAEVSEYHAQASAQSDRSLRCPQEETLDPYLPTERTAKTLIRLGGCPGIRPVCSESSLSARRNLGSLPTERTAKTLIRLGGCTCCSESSLGPQPHCWFCHVATHLVSNMFDRKMRELQY